MIDVGEFITEYLTKGFFRFNANEVLSNFDLRAFGKIKKTDTTFYTQHPKERYTGYTDLQEALLKQLLRDLSEMYFHELKHELRFSDMWSSANPNTYEWHNDTLRCWPGFNSSVNCYFDSTDLETGGSLQMHPNTYAEIEDNSRDINEVYPQQFDVIVINQNSNWMHRVLHTEQPRRMLAFAGAFFDFNPVI